jgi:hypothetical protein
MTTMEEQQNTNWADNDSKPSLSIRGFDVIATNCKDRSTARALAELRMCEIEKRLADIKAERTVLNRHKHVLQRWLGQTVRNA